jgi:uncharacterized repeat protein (TIGR03803 family)
VDLSGGTFIWGYDVPLLEATDGNLYGATAGPRVNGPGTIYKLTLKGQYTLLHTFPMCADFAGICHCQLVQGSDGVIYGGAIEGGRYGGGDIFALEAGLPVPAPRAYRLNPTSGAVGTLVLIWGANLLSASVMLMVCRRHRLSTAAQTI